MIRRGLASALFSILYASAALASGDSADVEFVLEDGVVTASVPAAWSISSDLVVIDAARDPVAAIDGGSETVGEQSAQRSFLVPDSEFRSFEGSTARYVAVEVVIERYYGAEWSILRHTAIDRAYFSCNAGECTRIDWSAFALGTGYAQLITLADGNVIFNLPGKSQ